MINPDGTEGWVEYDDTQFTSSNDQIIEEILGVVKSIAEEIATLHAKVDKIDNKIDNLVLNQLSPEAPEVRKSAVVVDLDNASTFTLIDSHEKFDELEERLQNDVEYRSDLVSHKCSCFIRVCLW